MIVMKFGGTSVEDSRAIDRVVEIVRARLHEQPVVVVALRRCLSHTLQGQGFGIRFMPDPATAVTLAV